MGVLSPLTPVGTSFVLSLPLTKPSILLASHSWEELFNKHRKADERVRKLFCGLVKPSRGVWRSVRGHRDMSMEVYGVCRMLVKEYVAASVEVCGV